MKIKTLKFASDDYGLHIEGEHEVELPVALVSTCALIDDKQMTNTLKKPCITVTFLDGSSLDYFQGNKVDAREQFEKLQAMIKAHKEEKLDKENVKSDA